MSEKSARLAGQEAFAEEHFANEPKHTPIDLDHLSRQALGDPGLTDEVLRLYATMAQVYLKRIEDSTTTSQLVEHLHTLKSAASGIGAWTVRDLAKRAEDALRSGSPVNPEHIEDIAIAVAECDEFISTLLVDNLA
jgi:HPt (histidine-containing phosphotransfer) domain-containing protein